MFIIEPDIALQAPTSQIIPPICGENSGQHSKGVSIMTRVAVKKTFGLPPVYVDIGAGPGDTAVLSWTSNNPAGQAAVARLWDVKVTQLECSNAIT